MKKVFAVTCLLFASIAGAYAQNDSLPTYRNIISVNINGLLTSILSQPNSAGDPAVIYRRVMKNNTLRIGIAGSLRNDNNIVNDTGQRIYEYHRFTFRTGIERNIFRYKGWSGYCGGDLVLSYYHFHDGHLEPGYGTVLEYADAGIGISPILGIVYQVNPRISFGLETNVTFMVERFVSDDQTVYPNATYHNTTVGTFYKLNYNQPACIQARISI